MSKIEADIIRARAGGVEVPITYAVRGSLKSWADADGSAAAATLRSSMNISSLVDIGTGVLDFYFATQMASPNYYMDGSGNSSSGGSSYASISIYPSSNASGLRMTYWTGAFASAIDAPHMPMMVAGDLA